MNLHYEYNAIVVSVVDGDTVDLIVDLGFDVRMGMRVRLYGINAPEIRAIGGPAAKAFLETMIKPLQAVEIATHKDRREKYGRYLATVLHDGTSVNALMVLNGHAVEYMV